MTSRSCRLLYRLSSSTSAKLSLGRGAVGNRSASIIRICSFFLGHGLSLGVFACRDGISELHHPPLTEPLVADLVDMDFGDGLVSIRPMHGKTKVALVGEMR